MGDQKPHLGTLASASSHTTGTRHEQLPLPNAQDMQLKVPGSRSSSNIQKKSSSVAYPQQSQSSSPPLHTLAPPYTLRPSPCRPATFVQKGSPTFPSPSAPANLCPPLPNPPLPRQSTCTALKTSRGRAESRPHSMLHTTTHTQSHQNLSPNNLKCQIPTLREPQRDTHPLKPSSEKAIPPSSNPGSSSLHVQIQDLPSLSSNIKLC